MISSRNQEKASAEPRQPPAENALRERFDRKVDRSGGPDACWPWLGSRDRDGYGKVYLRGRTLRASRVALVLSLGRSLDGESLHRCDNPSCCNPAHLREGTHAENIAEALARGRITREHGKFARAS